MHEAYEKPSAEEKQGPKLYDKVMFVAYKSKDHKLENTQIC